MIKRIITCGDGAGNVCAHAPGFPEIDSVKTPASSGYECTGDHIRAAHAFIEAQPDDIDPTVFKGRNSSFGIDWQSDLVDPESRPFYSL